MDDGRTYLDYLQNGWQWNKAKYRTEIRSLSEVVESLVKEVQAIENVQRLKSSTYAQVKSQLAIASRKKTFVLLLLINCHSSADLVVLTTAAICPSDQWQK